MRAVIFAPDGKVSMVVHGVRQRRLSTDPAFNPPGHAQLRIADGDYEKLRSEHEIVRFVVTDSAKRKRAIPSAIRAELGRLDLAAALE
jgi:hypothetical protein